MSKRDVTSEQSIFVLGMRDLGYLPEAVNGWAALMGASFGPEEELLSLDEMATRFDINHLNASAARVNFEKLDDFNGKWIRRLAVDDVAARVKPFLEKAGLVVDDVTLRKITPLIQPRLVTLDDAVDMAGFFFRSDPLLTPDQLTVKDLTPAQCAEALRLAQQVLETAPEPWTHAALEAPLRELAEELKLKPGQLFGLLRVAVTGQTISPPLFECMEVIGRDTALRRVVYALKQLESVTI